MFARKLNPFSPTDSSHLSMPFDEEFNARLDEINQILFLAIREFSAKTISKRNRNWNKNH
jgi:hypothetical protein